MDFGSLSSMRAAIGGLSTSGLIVIGLLAFCALGGACVCLYVAIRTGLEAWASRRARRKRHRARVAQRAQMQHARE